jgi:hypothetical protein
LLSEQAIIQDLNYGYLMLEALAIHGALLPQRNFDHQTAHDVIQLNVLPKAVWMGTRTANAGLAGGPIRLGSERHPVMPSCLDALRGRTLR